MVVDKTEGYIVVERYLIGRNWLLGLTKTRNYDFQYDEKRVILITTRYIFGVALEREIDEILAYIAQLGTIENDSPRQLQPKEQL